MVTVSRTTVAVVGGGPAGIVLGLLLARAGVAVRVIEKHDDFNRDFRGDTVHASTIRLLDELGLGDRFRGLPQSRLDDFSLPMPDGSRALLGDFSRLRPPYDHVAMVPQWDLLDMLVTAAREEPSFDVSMGLAATGTIEENGVITGVHLRPYRGDGGSATADDTQDNDTEELRADVVIACDGRDSVLRAAAGLRTRSFPVPFDTWWFRLPREPGDAPTALVPAFSGTDVLLSFPRPDYHQVAYFAPKGSDAALRAAGLTAFRERVARLRPDFADRVDAIGSMDDVHVLDVRMDRLERWWRPGLLCIGDAAHAMSPPVASASTSRCRTPSRRPRSWCRHSGGAARHPAERRTRGRAASADRPGGAHPDRAGGTAPHGVRAGVRGRAAVGSAQVARAPGEVRPARARALRPRHRLRPAAGARAAVGSTVTARP
ncbi:FAD-dependent oxidoreductase [Curtobacterium flaccumfaciens]|nr:FAD-dependent oxidoreductase [Curtobacterium flaccumfaciens]